MTSPKFDILIRCPNPRYHSDVPLRGSFRCFTLANGYQAAVRTLSHLSRSKLPDSA